jgi:hypothetical protein
VCFLRFSQLAECAHRLPGQNIGRYEFLELPDAAIRALNNRLLLSIGRQIGVALES